MKASDISDFAALFDSDIHHGPRSAWHLRTTNHHPMGPQSTPIPAVARRRFFFPSNRARLTSDAPSVSLLSWISWKFSVHPTLLRPWAWSFPSASAAWDSQPWRCRPCDGWPSYAPWSWRNCRRWCSWICHTPWPSSSAPAVSLFFGLAKNLPESSGD